LSSGKLVCNLFSLQICYSWTMEPFL